jgi:flavin reductase (DIM6/NTAB) family NADH-FMN oxidoreductase RutF
MTGDDMISVEFKRAMRTVASTVTIISITDSYGTRHGMVATAVNSVSMEPPSLLICVNHGASIHDPLIERGRFCVNVLTTEHEELVSAFSGRLKGAERFELGDWRDESGGMCYLNEAQCNIFCDVDRIVPFATHSIIIGRVTGVCVAECVAPLIFADGRFLGNPVSRPFA